MEHTTVSRSSQSPAEAVPARTRPSLRAGYFYAGSGFALWGVLPVFWKRLAALPAEQILCHRIIWSAIFIAALVWCRTVLRRRSGAPEEQYPLREVVRDPRSLRVLCLTAVLITVNWGLYIWAVNAGKILQASLGYYICPLLSMLLGVVVLGERLRGLKIISVAIVTVTVVWFAARQGQVPWIALGITFSWSFYTLLRKQVRAGALEGLLVETVFLVPFAASYLLWCESQGRGILFHGLIMTTVLLVSTGAITTVPLLLYNAGVRIIPLTSVALMQYLTPTISFLLAVFLYGEPWTHAHLLLFSGIWSGIALSSWSSIRESRTRRPHPG